MKQAPGDLEQTATAHGDRFCRTRPGHGPGMRRRVVRLEGVLRDAERRVARRGETLTDGRSAEWLLDNAYLIAQALHQVADALPTRFVRKLPRLAEPPHRDVLRVYALAREFAGVTEDLMDPVLLTRFLQACQETAPLSMGELWALPAMLRLVVLEELAEYAGRLLQPSGSLRNQDTPEDSTVAEDRIATCITSLRFLDTYDWKEFFESVSRVEKVLRNDHVYGRMDFETRDRYRKVVEQIAYRHGEAEEALAGKVVELARRHDVGDGQRAHVGYYLLDEGRLELEAAVLGRVSLRTRWVGGIRRRATPLYLGPIAVGIMIHLGALLAYLRWLDTNVLASLLMTAIAVVPALTVAMSIVNWVVTHLVPPRVLPKLDFDDVVPDSSRTMVVIPALLTSRDEVRSLLYNLEMNSYSAADPNVTLALLTDFADAPRRQMPEDRDLLEAAVAGVHELNVRHGREGFAPFALFHRERLWNSFEGCWMGWERKRGKLVEFNRLVLGAGATSYTRTEFDGDLSKFRYVITLDADTHLPPSAAARLIATLAHPLNHARFDEAGRVVSGYTVLQPRVEITPGSAVATRFASLFHADTGLDLYTMAVSDVYQDVFGEGIFAGKGIYDVAAFERSQAGRVPENAILSHDLFEGIHGRAGLVSDVVLFEEYPSHFLGYARRMHRWVRGDWQISPWILPRVVSASGVSVPNVLSLISRWKVFDNLRRSLLAPTLLLFALLAWFVGPPPYWVLSLAACGVLAVPIVLSAASAATRMRGGTAWGAAVAGAAASIRMQLMRWLLALVFLPYETWVVLDAIVRTLFRVIVSRKGLLQWTSAAHTASQLSTTDSFGKFWREMAIAPIGSGLVAAVLWSMNPQALPAALPFLTAWFISPYVALFLSRPVTVRDVSMSEPDRRILHVVARRTWHYFERFIGPDDHWLAPDNVQYEPERAVIRRTSPTNLGLALVAPVAAYDFGYIGVTTLAAMLRNMVDGMARLERHRGHFLNWYDTTQPSTLSPRYVSTVDSGNLAACLIVVGQACKSLLRARARPRVRRNGLLDTAAVLEDVVRDLVQNSARDTPGRTDAMSQQLASVRRRVLDTSDGLEAWRALLDDLSVHWIVEFETLAAGFIAEGVGTIDDEALHELRIWTERMRHQIVSGARELDNLVPWLDALTSLPRLYTESGLTTPIGEQWHRIHSTLASPPALQRVDTTRARFSADLARLDELVDTVDSPDAVAEAQRWNRHLREAVDRAVQNAARLSHDLRAIVAFADSAIAEMDFAFLLDKRRLLFHIGYNVTSGQFDQSYYDLLASEARIASIIAIAKGDVPLSHWIHLRRPFGRLGRRRVLLAWGGTMFEFLMPNLFAKAPPESLLGRTGVTAVRRQMSYAARFDVPWGISESAFYHVNKRVSYQYRAFGVPGLGLRTGLGDRLVISPYASLLALRIAPHEVIENIGRLCASGMLGRYGLYEALDFGAPTASRRRDPATVRSYMSHHQGMILQALDNFLNDDVQVRRFHADPRIASVDLLLYERVPRRVPVERKWIPEQPAPAGRRVPEVTGRWRARRHSPVPQVHLLSNGRYSVLLTPEGGGGSWWHKTAVTRWRSEPSMHSWGSWIYVKDRDTDHLWSVGQEPTGVTPEAYDVWFAPHMVEYMRRDDGLSLRMVVTVPFGDDAEIRRVTVANETDRKRHVALTSYGEVVLADALEDRRHQAFTKLFVESSFDVGRNALVFRRRPRSGDEPQVLAAHGVSIHGGPARVRYESDRRAFRGRHGAAGLPAAVTRSGSTSQGAVGPTLDPVFSLECDFELEPGEETVLVFVTAAAGTESQLLAILDGYRSLARVDWALEQARSHKAFALQELGISGDDAPLYQSLLSAIMFPYHSMRRLPEGISADVPAQPGLWAHGISGDRPILLVRVGGEQHFELVRQVVAAHRLWRGRQYDIDLVLLDEESSGYAQPAFDRLQEALQSDGGSRQPDGVTVLRAVQLTKADRSGLEYAASVILDTDSGSLSEQLNALRAWRDTLPVFVPVATIPLSSETTPPLLRPRDLQFDNGLGGFSADGREYVIHLEPGEVAPAPWVNVVANPDFGFLVSENGAGPTWSLDSGENRLTPWRNDPVSDAPGEALYLRDEETAEVWSPTPAPAPAPSAYQVHYGAGYTVFHHNSHGLEHELLLFVARDAPVKVARLTLTNRWHRHRRLTATYYAEWVLGDTRDRTAAHIVSELDDETGALLARNPFSHDFGHRIAFLAASQAPHGFTADRTEFLGVDADLARPPGLYRIGLSGSARGAVDPCAALQIHVDLEPGQTTTVHFLMGQGEDIKQARDIIHGLRDASAVQSAFADVEAFWDDVLSMVQVTTPDPATNLMLNRWLLYQTLACRVWGRTALYQSSGAFGFRDQLQDIMALVVTRPDVARQHLLEAARHQFAEGDVLHWWHPAVGDGVRTRCSDDLLWLPFVVAHYVRATGDRGVLSEEVPFVTGEPLAEDQAERYGRFEPSAARASLYEHCLRAIERGRSLSTRGLPLMGSCDWNDGLNRVGAHGRGESVWLGWFLCAVLRDFTPVCQLMDDSETALHLGRHQDRLHDALERYAWDGQWYRRAFYDDGTALGSAASTEARIDSISQSWAIISEAGQPHRAAAAVDRAIDHLVLEREGLVLLLDPPFDKGAEDPGYIKAYPPGVRENGGQYTHAAVWLAWAQTLRGNGDSAFDIFRMLNPITHTSTGNDVTLYRGEPYAVAADVYGRPPYLGRAGWTWYTGAAAWLYRLGIEQLVGLRKEGRLLRLDPCIPAGWPRVDIVYRYGRTVYAITIDNPHGGSRGIDQATLDGAAVDSTAVPLEDDGLHHQIVLRLQRG